MSNISLLLWPPVILCYTTFDIATHIKRKAGVDNQRNIRLMENIYQNKLKEDA